MKKIDHVILSGTKCSRRISSYLFFSVLLALLAGCDDSSSASAENSEPAALSSAEKQGRSSSSSVSSADSETLSSSSRCAGASEECDEAISSDSNAESNGSSRSSSSEKNAESSSSEKLSGASSDSADMMESSSSSVTLATRCKTETEDNCEYGTLLDDRDGQTYKAVKIGAQWWMAENLNYKTDNSFCYNDSAEYCEKYGRLYTWAAAMDSAGTWSTNGKGCGYGHSCLLSPFNIHGVCPDGWHLPRDAEWDNLFTAVGGQSTAGSMLKSMSGWNGSGNGTDAYGFSALPAGIRDGNGNFYGLGYYADFWSSSEHFSNNAYNMHLYYSHGKADKNHDYKKEAYSVRCVKD